MLTDKWKTLFKTDLTYMMGGQTESINTFQLCSKVLKYNTSMKIWVMLESSTLKISSFKLLSNTSFASASVFLTRTTEQDDILKRF